MSNCLNVFPRIKKHPFKIIAFDWDGTAVEDRMVDARPVAGALEDLLKFGVYVVVITGTNFGNIDRQFSSLITGPHKQNLYICTNRGSEVYGFDSQSEPVTIFRREATDEENALLSRIAEAVKHDIEARSNASINIVYNRLNRRKIDLIPEWESPPKSQIGELLKATEERLKRGGFSEGIYGAFNLAVRYADEFGLSSARVTSDVKHVEVGLTDKSDSINWVINELSKKRNIPFRDILIIGDEFGPIAGFEGSDFRTYLPKAPGITYISVGKEPNGVPEGVIHVGGGPACFLQLIKEQGNLYRKFSPTDDPTFLLIEEGYEPLREREIESLFTVGNGYLGARGSIEERMDESEPATLVAGVYDRKDTDGIEELIVVPDWLITRIYIEGRELRMNEGRILEHRRILDMKKGTLRREWRHRDEEGRVTSVKFLRFASLAEPHAMALKITVVPENYRGEIRVETGIERCLAREYGLMAETIDMGTIENNEGVFIATKTRFTGITVAEAQLSRIAPGSVKQDYRTFTNECGTAEDWRWQASAGQVIEIEKFISIYTSRDTDDPVRVASARVIDFAARGLSELFLEHIDAWERRWDIAAITIEGNSEAQLWVNFAGYHLITAGNPFDERVSISARTLTGTIYKGHVFWDADMFMLPFFIYTHPSTARAMLMYRYHTLPGARKEAQALGLRGALFAWESTATGEEMTPEFVIAPTGGVILILSGKLEQHINAAVAHGVWLYWISTLDEGFFVPAGAEILIETARFWASRVEKKDDVYHIYNIEGPDEYHEIVNDNIYTNMMAAWNMERASDAVNYLKRSHPEEWLKLKNRIELDDGEPDEWGEIATKIYKDMDHGSNLIEQFDGFFSLKDIDVYDFQPQTAPLDTVLGKEETAVSQLVKQADVVMLLYLLEDEFSEEVIKENFEYYERRTGHGSSLSPSMYGLVAARLGLIEMAMRYLYQAGTIDLANNMGNAAGGVHAAALGGLWQQIIMGFAGIRIDKGGISLYPKLPEQWKRLKFSLLWRDHRLNFDAERDKQIMLVTEGRGEVGIGTHGRSLQTLVSGRTYRSNWDGITWQEFVGLE
ncbi:MAG: hypothetical protein IBX64_02410 [Actinobacteria bacterium]|nr:hypothetical protein [Actinomycetota bacterium]